MPKNAQRARKQDAKFVRMTTQPVGGLVTAMAIPSIVSMLVSGIYNLADTFFIGQINTPSVAAMGIVYAYMVLIQSLAIFFGQGSGNYISRALGRRETVDAEEMAAVGLGSSILTGVILFFILSSEFFINYQLRFSFGHREESKK